MRGDGVLHAKHAVPLLMTPQYKYPSQVRGQNVISHQLGGYNNEVFVQALELMAPQTILRTLVLPVLAVLGVIIVSSS